MKTQRLFVTCSDRGQHHSARLGEILSIDGRVSGRVETQRGRVALTTDKLVGVAWDAERRRFEIRCPRCNRHLQWTEGTAQRVVTDLVEQMGTDVPGADGVAYTFASLDISRVP